jgi:aminoglycoside phosphotransferase (APT) family kinase protein
VAGLADPRRTAADLAGFLAALRAVDATDGPPPEWSNGFRGCDLADPRDSPVVHEYMAHRIGRLEGVVDTGPLRDLWARGLATPVWSGPPVWVHGDPAPGNLLAHDGRLSAVIDFGTLAVGDPAVDMIGAWTLLDPDGRAVFRDLLGVDDDTWTRGRVWGLSALLPAPEEVTDRAVAALEDLVADR